MRLFLLSIDHWFFLTINHLPHSTITDTLALALSGVWGGMFIIWLLLSICLFIREERRDHWFFLPIVIASGLSILITDELLKNFFGRNRPPLSLGVINVGPPLMDHSFPSGHATVAWAMAIVLANKEPRARWLFYILAFLISLSRVYLGKHYPYDVVAGTLVGIAIGYFALWLERLIVAKYHKRRRK